MFYPFTQNDQDFIDDAISQGLTKEEALNLLDDKYLEMQMEYEEELNNESEEE